MNWDFACVFQLMAEDRRRRWRRCETTNAGRGGEETDAEWAIVEALLQFPQGADRGGRSPAETRAVLSGLLWILRTGT